MGNYPGVGFLQHLEKSSTPLPTNPVSRDRHCLTGAVVERRALPGRLLAVLDDEVSQHAEDERDEEDDDLDIDAGHIAVAEGDDEPNRLPQTVVGEGRLSL